MLLPSNSCLASWEPTHPQIGFGVSDNSRTVPKMVESKTITMCSTNKSLTCIVAVPGTRAQSPASFIAAEDEWWRVSVLGCCGRSKSALKHGAGCKLITDILRCSSQPTALSGFIGAPCPLCSRAALRRMNQTRIKYLYDFGQMRTPIDI